MRVTMLIRCLAMMRGGGETRHLAWIRELSQLSDRDLADLGIARGEIRFVAKKHAVAR